MKFTSLAFVMIILSLLSCLTKEKPNKNKATSEKVNSSEKKADTSYHIYLPEKGKDKLNISTFADTVFYIPLETNKNSLLKGIGQIRMNDSIIAISDNRKLLLFSKDGAFLRQVGTSGKGPGEYLLVFNFELNGDTIYLTTTGKRSIIKYTLDGKFQEEIEVGNQLTHFSLTPKGQIVWYNNDKGELQYFNASMELINKLKPENLIENTPFYMIWDTFDRYFQISSDKLLFTSYFSDTIWNVSNGKKEATYIFNLQDKLLPRELQARYDGDSEKYEKQAARYQKINLLETQDKLFIFQKSWAENDLNTIYIHEIEPGTTQKYTGPFIYDDLLSGMELRIRSNHCLDNALVAVINPIDLLEELEKLNTNDNTEAYDLWKKKMQHVKYDDNPVLAIIRLK